jgi:hypothetical protein
MPERIVARGFPATEKPMEYDTTRHKQGSV